MNQIPASVESRLRLLNVSNSGHPIELGSYNTPGEARDVTVSEGIAYVADGAEGLIILRYTGHLNGRVYLPLVLRRWPLIPETPTLYAINNPGGDGSYTVSWSAAERATSYVLQEAVKATAPADGDFTQVYAGPNLSRAISGKGAARYHYRVKARNSWGDSAWSNVEWVDVLWEAEPNGHGEDVGQANGPLVSGKTYRGYPNDQDDYYYFELLSQTRVSVVVEQFAPTSTNGTVQLWGPAVGDERGDQIDYYGEPGDSSMPLGPHALGPGKYYVRVYTAGGHSTTQSYRLRLVCVPNSPPNTPSNPSPADDATDQSVGVNLSWTGGDPDPGDTVTYDVYLEADDSTPDTLICNDAASAFCDPGKLDGDTHYYWKVAARDEHGEVAMGPVWDFTTSTSNSFQDDFDDPGSGWMVRRTSSPELDTMDVRFSGGRLYTKADDRWDFGIFSPLVEAPAMPYKITMETKLVEGVDAPGYGIVFRAEEGSFCPVDRGNAQDDSGCFYHYLRLNVVIDKLGQHIRYEVKRIEEHDDRGRAVGQDLSGGYHTVDDKADWDGWNTWEIEVHEKRFEISVNGEHIGTYYDAHYTEGKYFGILTSCYEYNPSEFEHEYFYVEPLG